MIALACILAAALIVGLARWASRRRARALPQGWIFGARVNGLNASMGMGERPTLTDGGFAFDFPPSGAGEVHAVTRDCIALGDPLRVSWRVTASEVTPVEQPDRPATVSIYLHEKGQDWSDPDARWYAPEAFPLIDGKHARTIPLTGWRNVNGQRDDARFARALRDIGRIGIAFGTADRRSHGVAGSGRFELLALEGMR